MCKVVGCDRQVVARGLCHTHYQSRRRSGELRVEPRPHGTLEERFFAKVKMGDGCWEWLGAKSGKGYGFLQQGGRGTPMMLAHRISYKIANGPIADRQYILHACDNPGCVNPKHLRAGTQSENIKEAFAKGRKTAPIAFGESNPRSKLTLEQAKFIKAHPELPHTELADLFGLSPNCIRGVRIGRTWKDA